MPPVNLDLRDAPLRQALEQLFAAAGAQFAIDPNVAGFVTLKINDQPFENALKLILRSSAVPLTYSKENNVYIVKVRTVDPNANVNVAPPPEPVTQERPAYQPLEVIPLTYVDPFDLQQILGVIVLPLDLRGQLAGGGIGGGIGGFGGGIGGGFGGGLGGGFGGGIGGGVGGFGGLGGGLGGFGGGIGGGGIGGFGGGGFGGGFVGGGRGF